jgi:hypothetical protein
MKWLNTNLLIIAGIVSLILAGISTIVGLFLFGVANMMPNLLAELTGVGLEVAIAALVIERLTTIHKRREWDFAYQELPRYATQPFVDIMRLLFLARSVQNQALPERYQYFVRRAERHLSDLQSNIEVSGIALDSKTYRLARQIERRLSWSLDHLQDPLYSDSEREIMEKMFEASKLVLELLQVKNQYDDKLSMARSTVTAINAPTANHTKASSLFMNARLDAQTRYLETVPHGTALSIAGDVDNDLSIDYFLLDHYLLTQWFR